MDVLDLHEAEEDEDFKVDEESDRKCRLLCVCSQTQYSTGSRPAYCLLSIDCSVGLFSLVVLLL